MRKREADKNISESRKIIWVEEKIINSLEHQSVIQSEVVESSNIEIPILRPIPRFGKIYNPTPVFKSNMKHVAIDYYIYFNNE